MGQVHDTKSGNNAIHHPLAERYRVVDRTEVCHENDGRRILLRGLLSEKGISEYQKSNQPFEDYPRWSGAVGIHRSYL